MVKRSLAKLILTKEELKKNRQKTEEKIQQTFEELASILQEQKNELLGELELQKVQKEKELDLQREGHDFILSGIHHSLQFVNTLLQEGTDVEIAVCKKDILTRFQTLLGISFEEEPIEEATLSFVGEKGTSAKMKSFVSNLGSIVSHEISVTETKIELDNQKTAFNIKEKFTFSILPYLKGERVSTKSLSFSVKILGPDQIEVEIIFFSFSQLLSQEIKQNSN